MAIQVFYTVRNNFRYFQGKEARQISALPDAWYYEPDNYNGNMLWSDASNTRDEAVLCSAAHQDQDAETFALCNHHHVDIDKALAMLPGASILDTPDQISEDDMCSLCGTTTCLLCYSSEHIETYCQSCIDYLDDNDDNE